MKQTLFPLLSALLLCAPASAQAVTIPSSLSVPVASLPLTLNYSVPAGSDVLLAQPLPAGVSYVRGSSKLGGRQVPDPMVGPNGTLYWRLPAATGAQLTLQLLGTKQDIEQLSSPILQRFDGDKAQGSERLLPISGTLVASDWVQAAPIKAPVTDQENAGMIKLPLEGTVITNRDKITVVVEGPINAKLAPTMNGQPIPESLIGTKTTQTGPGTQRLEYYGVPIKVGVNTLALGKDTVTVKLAGDTTQVQVEPLQLVADGVTPIRLRIHTLDNLGLQNASSELTLESNLEPLSAPASVGNGGYALKLDKGEGLLELHPQATPTTLRLRVLVGERVITREFEVRPDRHSVGVGMVSATLGLGDGSWDDRFSVQARAYYEGPVGDGKLYLSADKDDLPTTTTALPTYDRFVNYGDSSVETIPLEGIDPVAFTYDHPKFRASYRKTSVPLDILPITAQMTALTFASKTNPSVSGFVAALPHILVTDERHLPDGTRLLRLNNSHISDGTLSLSLISVDRLTNTELTHMTLVEGVDYVLDPITGVVTLTRPLDSVAGNLDTVYVSATYRVDDGSESRDMAYGAQVTQRFEVGAGELSVGVAAAHIDDTNTFGVGARYLDPQTEIRGSVLYSSGLLATAELRSRHLNQGGDFSVRYQGDDYDGLGKGTVGFTAAGHYDWQITPVYGVRLEGRYGQTNFVDNSLYGLYKASSQGDISLLGTYKLAPWTFGAGVTYGFGEDDNGFGLKGSVGYNRDPFAVEVSHVLPVSGSLDATTEAKFRYRITKTTALEVRDIYDWTQGTNVGALAVNTTLGRTNYIAAYETGNGSGQENRARFGVGTTFALNERLNLGVRGSYLRYLTSGDNEFVVGSDLLYRGEGYTAGLGADFSTKTLSGSSVVLRGGISGDINPRLNLGADATAQFGASQGVKLGFGYAYRGNQVNSLGYLRYLQGTLANGTPENVSAGLAAEYFQRHYAIRGGVDARMLLDDHDSFTYQPYLGLNVYVGDRFTVAGWMRGLVQPATDTSIFGYGLEAGVKVIPGLWLTGGYNFKGFAGIPTAGMYTREGAYVRLDLTLDETLNGAKK